MKNIFFFLPSCLLITACNNQRPAVENEQHSPQLISFSNENASIEVTGSSSAGTHTVNWSAESSLPVKQIRVSVAYGRRYNGQMGYAMYEWSEGDNHPLLMTGSQTSLPFENAAWCVFVAYICYKTAPESDQYDCSQTVVTNPIKINK